MSGFLGAGNVLMGRVSNAGVMTGLVLVGNTTSFKITETSEFKERISRGKSDYGNTLDSVAVKKPAALTVTLDDLRKENLALVMLGDEAVFTQAAATDSTKEFNLASVAKNVWLEIGALGITGVSVAVASVTKTLGTHYELNADLGLIMFLDAIGSSGTAVATYDVPAIAGGYTVTGGVNPTIKAKFVLDGVNLATGEHVRATVWEAVVTPTDGVDFLAADFSSVSFEGKLNKPDDKASAYEVTGFTLGA